MPSSEAGTVHIIGAGLAGLAAAVRLSAAGRAIVVHEASGQAGGRCRSYYDHVTGMVIDNGTHLLLSGNHAALDYLESDRRRECLGRAAGRRIRFRRSRRPRALDRASFRLARSLGGYSTRPARAADRSCATTCRSRGCCGVRATGRSRTDAVLGACSTTACRAAFFGRAQHRAAARLRRLAARLLRETLAIGGKACRPLIAPEGIGNAFVAPALRTLRERGIEVMLQHPAACAALRRRARRRARFRRGGVAAWRGRQRVPRRAALWRAPRWCRTLRRRPLPQHRQRAFPHRSAGRASRA